MRTALVVLVAFLTIDCGPFHERFRVYQRLLDMSEVGADGMGRLDAVVLQSQRPPEVRDVGIHGDRRPSLVLEAPARIAFRSEAVPSAGLRFGLAVRPPEAVVKMSLAVNGEVFFEEEWEPARGWVEKWVDLAKYSRGLMELELSFDGSAGTIMLAHPELVGRAEKRDVERPNVIIYLVDCLRADHVGAYGYELPTTPAMDALAGDSVLLGNLTACAPWTKPSTACMFTSLLPVHHRARTIDDALPQERITVGELFRGAGYTTAAWVANPVIDPRVFGFNQGFDRWTDLRSFEERAGRSHIHDLNPDAAHITEGVLPWLEKHRADQLFVYLHSIDLHYAYVPRPPFDDVFVTQDSTGLTRDRELYDNELAYNDREIGKLVSGLKELDLYDDTILLVTGDHGEEFGEHGFARHGKTLYQQVLHIPGILKLPDSRLAGRRVETLAGNIDLAPTLLELAGIESPEVFQGRSLVSILEQDSVGTGSQVFSEVVTAKVVSYAVRDERFKYVRNLVPEFSELLFDLDEDAAEERNLLQDTSSGGQRLLPDLERFVQLGQHGLHFSVRGEEPGARVTVRVQTEADAEISNAFRFYIVTGDVFNLSSDRKHVTLLFTDDGQARHLVVQTRPEGAPVRLEVYSDDAARESRIIRPKEIEVSVAEAERLLHQEENSVRIWYLPFTAGRNRVDLDEETTRNLRALGYIQ